MKTPTRSHTIQREDANSPSLEGVGRGVGGSQRSKTSPHLQPIVWAALLAVVFSLVAFGCKRGSNPSSAPTNSSPVRIVSLSPAITRTLVDLNLQASIVGRTPHCASVDQAIPVVGDLLNVNYEQLVRLQPTHILVQPPESGIDEKLLSMAKERGWHIKQWRLDSLDDIETLLREIPGFLFADGTKEMADSTAKAAELTNRIASALSPGTKPIYHGRTLLVYSVAPVSVFGQGTYLDGVLKALGGTNAISAKDWVSISYEDLVRLNPDAIIFIKPGLKENSPYLVAGSVWELDMTATSERRLAVLTHPDAFSPSTGVIGVAEELRGILETFGERP